jgi:hypothetical protein
MFYVFAMTSRGFGSLLGNPAFDIGFHAALAMDRLTASAVCREGDLIGIDR